MRISFPSIPVIFSARYGVTIPILADLSIYAIFSRVMTSAKAQMASLAVGVGALYLLASRASTLMGLAGAALYIVYKIRIHFYLSHSCSHTTIYIEDLEKSFEKLRNKFVVTDAREIDRKDPTFDLILKSIYNEQTAAQWEDPTVIEDTLHLLTDCHTLLFKIYGLLETETEYLRSDHPARLQKMVELIKDGNFGLGNIFNRAFSLFLGTYRFIRYKGCDIALPNLKNSDKTKKMDCVFKSLPTEDYCNLFIVGEGPHRTMNQLFNETQDRLGDLLKLLYSNPLLTEKDLQVIPALHQKPVSIANLEATYSNLLSEHFTYTDNRQFNRQDEDFNAQFGTLREELEKETDPLREKWEDPVIIQKTKTVLLSCQTLLYKIHSDLELKTASLLLDPTARLQLMADLLKKTDFDKFERAFNLLNMAYRFIRGKVYYIHLSNVLNAEEKDRFFSITGCLLLREESHRFFKINTPHTELRCIFNQTQDRLGDLLKVLFPDSPLNAKDEELWPGDYNNPINPFTISGVPAQPPSQTQGEVDPKPPAGSTTQPGIINSNHSVVKQ